MDGTTWKAFTVRVVPDPEGLDPGLCLPVASEPHLSWRESSPHYLGDGACNPQKGHMSSSDAHSDTSVT